MRRRPDNRGDAIENAADIPQAVLALDGDGGKTVTCQRFGDQRVGQAAPTGEYGLASVNRRASVKAGMVMIIALW